MISFLGIYFIVRINIKYLIRRQLRTVFGSSLFNTDISLNQKDLEKDFESLLNIIKDYTDTKHLEIEQLHDRDDFRKDFLGDVSHELKTPIFTAQGYILTLLDESFKDKKLQKKYLERAGKSIERLNFIVKDLDMISKLERGMDLNLESLNIIQLISEVFDILDIKAGKKNIILNFNTLYEFPILVNADKERIEQVLINLISNSINYGKDNGTTTVSIQTYSKDQFIIHIADDGIGIPKKELGRLFERFYRVDKSRSREQGGSGLGLSIVKHIIEAHGQQVMVKSEIDKGSIFSFTLNKVL
ncbi:MAG: ATP-binding protein [Flavobacteriaceae bacterium]|nr:ATP-binding protein [Flavobacteriaceae bacterium]